MEDDRFIEAIEEFRAEVGAQGPIHPLLHLAMAGRVPG